MYVVFFYFKKERIMNLNTGLLTYLFEGAIPQYVYFLSLLGVLLLSYLLGSVNTAIIVSRLVYREDIRTKGSGNAGMTNMNRIYGLKAAGMTLLGDLLKAAVSILIGGLLFGFGYVSGVSTNYILYLAALLVAIGHVFPCYYGFKGGKGVLVTAVSALILSPVIFAFLFVIFVIVVALWRYVSLGSITVAVLYPIALSGYFKFAIEIVVDGVSYPGQINGLIALSSILLAILIVWCHRANLKRIGDRTESKLTFKKKNNDE